jgi:hypothetical protein
MAAGDKYLSCERPFLTLEQTIRSMIIEDDNGGPILRMPSFTPPHPEIESIHRWISDGAGGGSDATELSTIHYNFDAGVNNAQDETPEFEVFAFNDPDGVHTGESFTVVVPANLEIHTPDGTWHSSNFTHILGDGTGSNPLARLKARIKSGHAVGTFTDVIKVIHPEFPISVPSGYNLLNVACRVATATHATTISWQSSLVGAKPSGILIYNLDNMIAGITTDGDMAEHDYFHMVRGMETDEQRLKPIKSTAGVDADLIGSGAAPNVFDRTGIKLTASTQKSMRLKWKPISNGVKCVQNNNCMYVTFDGSTTAAGFYAGIRGAGSVDFSLGKNAGSTMTNTRSWTSGFSTGGAHAANAFFGVRRTSSTAQESFINGVTLAGSAATSAAVSDLYPRMPGLANNSDVGDALLPKITGAKLHCIGIGSNSVSFTRVRARLNTYYAALGMSAA